MRFEVNFRNCRATDAIRERAQRKFEKVAKHLQEPIEAHMQVHIEKHQRHCAELHIVSKSDTFQVTEETDDMYATIDGLFEKAERHAKRNRERIIDRHQTGPGDEE